MTSRGIVAATLALVTVGTVHPCAAQRVCTAGQYKVAAKYALGLAKCMSAATKRGAGVDSVCVQHAAAKFLVKWARAESKGDCIVFGMADAVEALTDAYVGDLTSLLDPPQTTTSTSTTTSTTAISSCYTDMGLTVVDTCNDLEWEKKNGDDGTPGSGIQDAGNLHDVDNRYTWAGRCTLDTTVFCQPTAAAAATCAARTGGALGCDECTVGEGTCDVDPSGLGAITTVWAWINQVNGETFAGRTDWRLATSGGSVGLPTGQPAQLELLIDLSQGFCGGGIGACIDPIFGPTAAVPGGGGYWSASTIVAFPDSVWDAGFDYGSVFNDFKVGDAFVRAVRPGS